MTDMQYYSLLTNSGHQANIKAKALGLPIVLSKVAFGSGNITPTESATGLAKEEIRVNISSVIQNEIDKNILEIEAVIPSDVGGFMINEAALYLEDETLYAIINLPASYKPSIDQGAGKEFVFTILLASVGVENVTLKIDDSIVFATRKYVQNELKKYAFISGDETKKFKVATPEDDYDAVNKKYLEENSLKINSLTRKTTPTDTDNLVIQETGGLLKKLSWANLKATFFDGAMSLTPNGYIKFPTIMGSFIIQWGGGASTTTSGQTINFPITFPNEVFGIFPSLYDGVDSFPTINDTPTKSSFKIRGYASGGSAISRPFYWFAIGK